MQRRTFLLRTSASCAAGLLRPTSALADEGVAVIAHPSVRGLDAEAVRRVYSGRMVELDGQPLRPLQLTAGHPLRRRFCSAVLQQSDEDFIAYWTVRRYIGKGAPPRELSSPADVLTQVLATPGAIGYIDSSELRPGVPVLLRR